MPITPSPGALHQDSLALTHNAGLPLQALHEGKPWSWPLSVACPLPCPSQRPQQRFPISKQNVSGNNRALPLSGSSPHQLCGLAHPPGTPGPHCLGSLTTSDKAVEQQRGVRRCGWDSTGLLHTGLDDQVAHVGWREARTPITSITKVHFLLTLQGPSQRVHPELLCLRQGVSMCAPRWWGCGGGRRWNSHGQGTRRTWVLNT